MSLLGGFDLCVELSGELFGTLAQNALATEPAAYLSPVLQFVVPANGGVAMGTMEVLLTGIAVQPMAGDAMTPARADLTLTFQGSAVRVMGAVTDDARGLDGALALPGVPVNLVAAPPGNDGRARMAVAFNLAKATTASLHLLPPSARELDALFTRAGIDPAEGRAALESVALSQVQGFAALIPPASGTFVIANANEDGDPDTMRLIAPVVKTLPEGSDHPPVLCVLAMLLRGGSTTGNPAAKTDVATKWSATAATVLSPRALHHFKVGPRVFRAMLPAWLAKHVPAGVLPNLPSSYLSTLSSDTQQFAHDDKRRQFFKAVLASQTGDDLTRGLNPTLLNALAPDIQSRLRSLVASASALLPPSCGTADALVIDYAKIVRLDLALEAGRMVLTGRITPDVTGIDGSASFQLDLIPAVQGNAIATTVIQEPFQNEIHLAPWAIVFGVVAGAILGALLATGIGEIAGSLAIGVTSGLDIVTALDMLARQIAFDMIQSAFADAVSSVAAPTSLGSLDMTTLAAVAVTPEGLAVQRMGGPPRAGFVTSTLPTLSLHVTSTETGTDGPTHSVEIHDQCLNGRYSYHDRDVTTTYTVAAMPMPAGSGIRYAWTVDGEALSGSEGVLDRGSAGYRLHWNLVDGNRVLRISNEAGGATFLSSVACRAVRVAGFSADASRALMFDGRRRIWDAQHDADLKRCVMNLLGSLGPGPTNTPMPVRGVGPVSIGSLVSAALARGGGVIDPVALRLVSSLARSIGQTAVAADLSAGAAVLRGTIAAR